MSLAFAFSNNNNNIQGRSIVNSHHQNQQQMMMTMNHHQQQPKNNQGRRKFTHNPYKAGSDWVESNKQANNKQANNTITKLSTKELATTTIVDDDHHTDTNSDNGHELAETPKNKSSTNSTPKLAPAQPRSAVIDSIIKNSKMSKNNNTSNNNVIVHARFVSKYRDLLTTTNDIAEYRYDSIIPRQAAHTVFATRPQGASRMCLVVVGQILNPLFYQHGIEGMLAPIVQILAPCGIKIYEPDFGKREKGLLSFYVDENRLEETPALLHGRLLFDVDRFFYAETAAGLRAMNEYCDAIDSVKGPSSSRKNNNNNSATSSSQGPLIESFPHFAMTCLPHRVVFTQFKTQKRQYEFALEHYKTRSNDVHSWTFFEKWNKIAINHKLFLRDNNEQEEDASSASSSTTATTTLALDQKCLPKEHEITRFHCALESFLEKQQQMAIHQNNYYSNNYNNNNFYSYGHQHQQQQQMVPLPPPPPFVFPYQQH